MSRGVGQSRVEINTHTHKMILIWIYERMSEDLSATHTHTTMTFIIPDYPSTDKKKNLVLPSIYTVYGDFWKGWLWYWCLGAIWIFTMTWKKERTYFTEKKQENDFYREKVLLCVHLDLFLFVLSIWIWIVNSMDSGWRVGFY